MKVTNDIIYVGVNDHQTDLFEGQYAVPNGIDVYKRQIEREKRNHAEERFPKDLDIALS